MRLNNQMRDNILRQATAQVPVVDYYALLMPVIQEAICKHMPAPARAAYEDEASRGYMSTIDVRLKEGNGYSGNGMYFGDHGNYKIYGMCSGRELTVRIDDISFEQTRRGTLGYDVASAVRKSGYFKKYHEQAELLKDVKKRLKATLESVTTVKRLYDVLEPELHHLIPKEDAPAAKISLPAAAGPVVADLIKLGAQLPKVPKVEK